MGRPKESESLSIEQEEQFAAERPRVIFKSVARLFEFYFNHTAILPVYVRNLNTARCPALAVDFLADCVLCVRRIFTRGVADSILDQIAEGKWATVDPEIQSRLGVEWDRCQLLEVYAGVCNQKNREDGISLHKHQVQWKEQIEAEAEAIDLLAETVADTPASELEAENTHQESQEPEVEWLREDSAA